jgi:hypothetical protein
MKYYVILIIALFLLLGSCQSVPSTQHPTGPEKDSPLILGDAVAPPTGCVKWREKDNVEQEWKSPESCCPDHMKIEIEHLHASDC